MDGWKTTLVGAAMAVVGAGCAGASDEPGVRGAGADSAAARDRVQTDASCPAKDFDGFLERFAEEIDVQRRYVQYPLEVVRVDAGSESDESMHTQLAKNAVEFPVFLSRAGRQEHGVSYRVEKSPIGYDVLTRSEGTGAFSMKFSFVGKQGCWYLVRSEDYST